MRWEFVVHFDGHPKPLPFTVTVRCAASLNPQQVFQLMLSRDEEEIDGMRIKTATMSCKVDFSDPSISQELLDIVARWNKGLRRPESTLPGLKWCCERSESVAAFIRIAAPIVTLTALMAYYYKYWSQLDQMAAATNAFLGFSLIWLVGALVVLSIGRLIAGWLGSFAERHLDNLGRVHIFEITTGDANRQTKLGGNARRSLIKFVVSGFVSVIWNVVAAYFCVRFLGLS